MRDVRTKISAEYADHASRLVDYLAEPKRYRARLLGRVGTAPNQPTQRTTLRVATDRRSVRRTGMASWSVQRRRFRLEIAAVVLLVATQGCTVAGYVVGSDIDRSHYVTVPPDTDLVSLIGETVRVSTRDRVIAGRVADLLSPGAGDQRLAVIESFADEGVFSGGCLDTIVTTDVVSIQLAGEPVRIGSWAPRWDWDSMPASR